MKTVDAESPQRPMTEEAGVSLNELAYRRFKQALVTLSYKPGEYLNTAQVMNDLDMGRTPINQAIHRLANEGLLQVIPRKGVMVSPLSMDDALELIEVRLANEMLCMQLASQRITERQIATLTELNRQIEAASQERDRVRMMTLDHEFHQELAQIAGNNMLADILSVLHARRSVLGQHPVAGRAYARSDRRTPGNYRRVGRTRQRRRRRGRAGAYLVIPQRAAARRVTPRRRILPGIVMMTLFCR